MPVLDLARVIRRPARSAGVDGRPGPDPPPLRLPGVVIARPVPATSTTSSPTSRSTTWSTRPDPSHNLAPSSPPSPGQDPRLAVLNAARDRRQLSLDLTSRPHPPPCRHHPDEPAPHDPDRTPVRATGLRESPPTRSATRCVPSRAELGSHLTSCDRLLMIGRVGEPTCAAWPLLTDGG